MNILLVTNMYPSKERNSFGIFVKEQVESYRAQYAHDSIHIIPFSDGGYIRRYLLSSFRLFGYIVRNKVDIIHVHFGLTFLPLLLSLPVCSIKGVKIVTTFHGSDILGSHPLTKAVSRLATIFSDMAIGVSRQIHHQLSLRKNKVAYLPCGVTQEFYSLSKSSSVKASSIKRIIFPSSPARVEKNYTLFQKLTTRLAEELKEHIEFECIVMEGLTRKEVAELFNTSTCLLLTSNYEGSPQVIKEAIICDLPIVSTAVGDVPLLLLGEELAVVSNNEMELYQGLRKALLSENINDREYSSKLKKSVMNDIVGRQLRKIYQDLVTPSE